MHGNSIGGSLPSRAVTWSSARVTDCIPVDEEHLVSYLPMSHIAAQMIDIVVPLVFITSLLTPLRPSLANPPPRSHF